MKEALCVKNWRGVLMDAGTKDVASGIEVLFLFGVFTSNR
jgi:hypothetical protein